MDRIQDGFFFGVGIGASIVCLFLMFGIMCAIIDGTRRR